MPVSIIGALAGLAVAAGYWIFLTKLSSRVELPETRTALKVTGIIQFIVFPVAGWFIAPLLFGD